MPAVPSVWYTWDLISAFRSQLKHHLSRQVSISNTIQCDLITGWRFPYKLLLCVLQEAYAMGQQDSGSPELGAIAGSWQVLHKYVWSK